MAASDLTLLAGSRMARRTLLKALPAIAGFAAAARSQQPKPASDAPGHVVVVGAGIVGVSIAYHLARRGVRVTVVDKGRPGMGCTQGAFAMLIAGYPDGPAEFNALYGLAVRDWRRLETEIPVALPIQWGGTVNWAAPGARAAKLESERQRLASWGAVAQRLTLADLGRLCPGIIPGAFGAGSFLPDQGAVDVRGAFTILLAQCRRLGVAFRIASVTGFPVDTAGLARIVTTSGPI